MNVFHFLAGASDSGKDVDFINHALLFLKLRIHSNVLAWLKDYLSV